MSSIEVCTSRRKLNTEKEHRWQHHQRKQVERVAELVGLPDKAIAMTALDKVLKILPLVSSPVFYLAVRSSGVELEPAVRAAPEGLAELIAGPEGDRPLGLVQQRG
jgi:hypothetical protein